MMGKKRYRQSMLGKLEERGKTVIWRTDGRLQRRGGTWAESPGKDFERQR